MTSLDFSGGDRRHIRFLGRPAVDSYRSVQKLDLLFRLGIYKLQAIQPADGRPLADRRFGDIEADAVNIIVRSYHELKPYTEHLPGKGRLVLADGETVAGVLRKLGIASQQTTNLVLFINGRAARPETRLTDGDTLVFFSAIAGG